MRKVTRELIRERALVIKAKAYFKKASARGWHVSGTEVLKHINARPPYSHLSPDTALILEAAKACRMTYTMKRSILVFHPKGRNKDNEA